MAGEEDLADVVDDVCDDEETARRRPSEKIEPPTRSSESQSTKLKSDNLYWHGPHASEYESFVRGLYKVGGGPVDSSVVLNSFSTTSDVGTNLPASLLLKIETLSSANGKDGLNSKYFPYESLGKSSDATYTDDIQPLPYKSQYAEDYSNRYGNFKSEFMRNLQTRLDDEAKNPKPKCVLLDRKKYGTSPLSKHLYSDDKYVHKEDSRIVGSDFVMLTLRPNDNFLNKIDKTLAEARKVNSWNM